MQVLVIMNTQKFTRKTISYLLCLFVVRMSFKLLPRLPSSEEIRSFNVLLSAHLRKQVIQAVICQ